MKIISTNHLTRKHLKDHNENLKSKTKQKKHHILEKTKFQKPKHEKNIKDRYYRTLLNQ